MFTALPSTVVGRTARADGLQTAHSGRSGLFAQFSATVYQLWRF
jgi:hypothetical protein